MKMMMIFFIPLLIFATFLLISFKSLTNKEKLSPFECGFDPFSLSRIPFSLKFFLIAIIFLIFDIEIVIILPFPLLFFNKNILFLITFIIINILISWGLIYEWKSGMLEWLK
uniref:NADH dehydrogenase subunit 3 n=1 Tax=Ixodes pacificus TaxID=29930 RepID=UPI00223875C0|nr:NADH dehydrogenase subunit 3 [Ixodes pacificus]UYB78086.1 NADH dehydrogenase subunit 3 [Ixodes pacificus]UYB78099.1 NADH dehydrogenase subunit 3 [Ixodes pacificus]WKW95283.1 NADH dehydrogenase subunit 3 [Ixodes pacificus]